MATGGSSAEEGRWTKRFINVPFYSHHVLAHKQPIFSSHFPTPCPHLQARTAPAPSTPRPLKCCLLFHLGQSNG